MNNNVLLVKIVDINNACEIYSLSTSTDRAEICSPMEPNHNVIQLPTINFLKFTKINYSHAHKSNHVRAGYVLYRALVMSNIKARGYRAQK